MHLALDIIFAPLKILLFYFVRELIAFFQGLISDGAQEIDLTPSS